MLKLVTHIKKRGAVDVDALCKANTTGVVFQLGLLGRGQEGGLPASALKTKVVVISPY